MKTNRLVVCLLIAAFTSIEARAAKPVHKLKLELGATYIDVERATAVGEVLLIGYELIAHEYSREFKRVEREATASTDGKARFELGREPASNSFWVAIDLTSAAYAAISAGGHKLREGEFLAANLHQDSAGHRRKARARFEYVHALVVRPRGGVWQMTAGDGGPSDADGSLNGTIDIDTHNFEQRGLKSNSELDEYREADLLFVFVPSQVGYLVTQVSR